MLGNYRNVVADDQGVWCACRTLPRPHNWLAAAQLVAPARSCKRESFDCSAALRAGMKGAQPLAPMPRQLKGAAQARRIKRLIP